MALGETITTLRKQKGLSQEQLSEELGLTRQTISKWELNQSTPDIEYIIRLSEIFQVSTDFLLIGKTVEENDGKTKEENSTAETIRQDNRSNKKDAFGWCFGLGLTFSGISFIGIIIFVICAALNPWKTYVNNQTFTGLLGFLKGTGTEGFFYFLIVILIISLAFAVYGIIGRFKTSQKKQ